MTTIKLASPGVPDIYQGTEIWDYSLVDPDNRRQVDYAYRRKLLDTMSAVAGSESMTDAAREMASTPDDGRAKLWVVWRALGLRRAHALLFEKGDYAPVAAMGARADHVVAFVRRYEDVGVIALAGRLWASLGVDARVPPLGAAVWSDTAIDAGLLPAGAEPQNALTGERVAVGDGRILLADAFANFPAALLLYNIGTRK
jgi:(1->4)-alpha-D-glucan 1-alpha-D-glucosylmutase